MFPIYYSVISRGQTILVQNAFINGNFDQNYLDIINKISDFDSIIINENKYYILKYEEELFFGLVTSKDYDDINSLNLLNLIKNKFLELFLKNWKKVSVFGMQQEFGFELKIIITNYFKSNINLNSTEISIFSSSENSESKINNAKEYIKHAEIIKRKFCWEKFKYYFLIFLILLIFLIIFIIICNGFNFKKC